MIGKIFITRSGYDPDCGKPVKDPEWSGGDGWFGYRHAYDEDNEPLGPDLEPALAWLRAHPPGEWAETCADGGMRAAIDCRAQNQRAFDAWRATRQAGGDPPAFDPHRPCSDAEVAAATLLADLRRRWSGFCPDGNVVGSRGYASFRWQIGCVLSVHPSRTDFFAGPETAAWWRQIDWLERDVTIEQLQRRGALVAELDALGITLRRPLDEWYAAVWLCAEDSR